MMTPPSDFARHWINSLGLRRHRSIQSVLVWLVLACIVPAGAAAAMLIALSYERDRANVERDTIATARALMLAVEGRLRGAQSALQVLAMSHRLASGDLAGFYDEAREAVQKLPGFNIAILDAGGRQVMNTLSPLGAPLPVAGFPAQLLRPFETGKPLISDLFLGPVVKKPIVSVVVPVVSKGQTVHVLGMGIYSERLAEILHEQNIPATWVGVIFDSTGTIVARTQMTERYVGAKAAPEVLRSLSERAEGMIEADTLESIPALIGFSRSAASGWAVAIAVPREEALGPLRRTFTLSIVGTSLLLLICLVMARSIGRRIAGSVEVLAEHAAELGEGKLVAIPPLGITSVDEVAQAMVNASHALHQRAAEREEAERNERRLLVAKRAAEEASQAKSDFLALLSHEIRTPLTLVIGMTELLLDSSLTAQQRRHAVLLKESGELLLAMIDDLLDMSKIEAGKLELAHVPVSLAEVAEGALAIVRPQAAARNIDLRSELAPDLPAWIEGDPTRLRQILLNLLSNALKYTEHGSVALRIGREPGAEAARLRFEVADTGIGIDATQQGSLFQRFSRVGERRNRPRGSGLGLAISRQLVEAMGGEIGVQSRLGAGSIFWFTITYVATRSPATIAAAEPVPSLKPHGRILVAEDQDMIRELMETILTEAGHEVVLARSGVEAVAAVEKRDFDLALMDIEMPDMDGLTATRRIRQMDERIRNIPIIILTAYAMTEDMERSRVAGANEHLSKPVKRNDLLRAVEKWISRKQAPSAAGTLPVVDPVALSHLENRLGKAEMATLARHFREQVDEAISDITSTTDRAVIGQRSYAIVSLAGLIGCTELTMRSRALMDAARRETGDLHALVAELSAAAARVFSALCERYAGASDD